MIMKTTPRPLRVIAAPRPPRLRKRAAAVIKSLLKSDPFQPFPSENRVGTPSNPRQIKPIQG
jgi:hypothetical protein